MKVSDYTALLSSWTWGDQSADEPLVITYALNSAIESYWYTYNPTAVIDSFKSAKQVESTINEAFGIWESAANIQLVQVGGNDAAINIGLFDFSRDASTSSYAGYAYFPGDADETDGIAGDIFIDVLYQEDLGIWLHEIGHALGLEHPHEGEVTLHHTKDNTSETVMSYNGAWKDDIGTLDRQAAAEMYKGTVQSNLIVSEYEILNGTSEDNFKQLRDFDGNNLGATADWKKLGQADVQLDSTDEFVFVNATLGRWATVGADTQGIINFDNHGEGGDTRVVGVYLDPLVEAGVVQKGSDIDSARRLENDLKNDNLKLIEAQDFDKDGFQNMYFKTADGTAYLNALMHADGNVRYANYQSEADMIDYMVANGWDASTYNDWLSA